MRRTSFLLVVSCLCEQSSVANAFLVGPAAKSPLSPYKRRIVNNSNTLPMSYSVSAALTAAAELPKLTASRTSSATATVLHAKNDGSEDTDNEPKGYTKETGLVEGYYLFGLAMLVSIWMFSVPVEYRRAQLCSEQEVIDNPTSNCMTMDTWTSGIADYYRNGGGVKFDFSVDPNSKFVKKE